MPDHTTTSAAQYLAEHGYIVHSKRDGTDKAPNGTTIKQWCERGKIPARKVGWVWLIDQEELDRILEATRDDTVLRKLSQSKRGNERGRPD